MPVCVLPITTPSSDVSKAQFGPGVMAFVLHMRWGMDLIITSIALTMELVLLAAVHVQTCALLLNWTTFTNSNNVTLVLQILNQALNLPELPVASAMRDIQDRTVDRALHALPASSSRMSARPCASTVAPASI